MNKKRKFGDPIPKEWLDLMNVDKTASFVNIDLTPPADAPEFLKIISARFNGLSDKDGTNDHN
jgi:hypothetical protein